MRGIFPIVILNLLLHTFVTSKLVITRTPSTIESIGFRCDTKIFMHETLLAATHDAFLAATQNAEISGSSSEGNRYPYPKQTQEYFGFEDERKDGYKLLWPLMDPGDDSWKNGQVSQIYFVAIQGSITTQFQPIGVVEMWTEDYHRKCLKERDLSFMYGHQIVTGYRCPTEIFPMKVIGKGMILAERHLSKRVKRNFPARFESKIFDFIGSLYRWPIASSGTFNARALASIILDENSNFIGMAHRNDKYIVRCHATPFDQFAHQFVSSNILQLLDPPKPDEVDVFQCGQDFIKSNIALEGAAEALLGFKSKRRDRHRPYPVLFPQPINKDHSERLYLWPIDIENLSIFKPNSKHFKTYLVFFIVITDFSNVLGVVRKRQNSEYEKCDRKIVTLDFYKKYHDGLQNGKLKHPFESNLVSTLNPFNSSPHKNKKSKILR